MILSLRDISENTGKTEKTQADLGFRDITVLIAAGHQSTVNIKKQISFFIHTN